MKDERKGWMGLIALTEQKKRNRLKREVKMTRVHEIQAAIESLPQEDYNRLRRWFSERDWEEWDKQIEADSKAGKLGFLTKEASEGKAKGYLKDL